MPKPTRTITLKARVTEDERDQVAAHAAAAGVSVSEYLRSNALAVNDDDRDQVAALRQRLAAEQERLASLSVDPNVHRELVRIGNNLNQIARGVNRHRVGDPLDAAAVAVALSSIYSELVALRDALAS